MLASHAQHGTSVVAMPQHDTCLAENDAGGAGAPLLTAAVPAHDWDVAAPGAGSAWGPLSAAMMPLHNGIFAAPGIASARGPLSAGPALGMATVLGLGASAGSARMPQGNGNLATLGPGNAAGGTGGCMLGDGHALGTRAGTAVMSHRYEYSATTGTGSAVAPLQALALPLRIQRLAANSAASTLPMHSAYLAATDGCGAKTLPPQHMYLATNAVGSAGGACQPQCCRRTVGFCRSVVSTRQRMGLAVPGHPS